MAGVVDTQPYCQQEGLNDIFLSCRTSVENILQNVFESSLTQGSIVSISGSSGSGKTSLIKEIVVESLLQSQDVEVLLLDVDKDFRIVPLMRSCMKRGNQDGLTEEFSDRLSIITCYENDFDDSIVRLKRTLSDNSRISIIVIDSLGAFYFSQDSGGRKIKSKENFIADYLKKFVEITKKFKVTIVFTLPDFITKSNSAITTHSIELVKRDQQSNLMTVKSKQSGSYKEINFTLGADGINFDVR